MYAITNAQVGDSGNYVLVVSNFAGSATSSVAVVSVVFPPPVANFSASPLSGTAPLIVYFTNLSQGATNYAWDFGDGNSSTNANPANTYALPGSYNVSLVAIGPGGTNSLGRPAYILVTEMPPVILPGPQVSGDNFLFSFPTTTNKTYTVQYSDSLDGPNWQTLQVIPGDGFIQTITNSLSLSTNRFFRLSVQ
jgi:PKD repeat protein